MSPAVDQIRKTVEARIRELGPVINELEQLQSILTLLEQTERQEQGSDSELSTADASQLLAQVMNGENHLGAPQQIRRSRRGTKPGRDGRAPQGANKQRIIETVQEDPGVTATEIAERTGLKRTVVSATINRLKRNGELEPDGRGVRIPRVAPEAVPA